MGHASGRSPGSAQVLLCETGSAARRGDLAWHLSEPVELVERPDGIEVSIEVTGSLGSILGEIRDWALRHGLESVEVTVNGQPRTLVVSNRDA